MRVSQTVRERTNITYTPFHTPVQRLAPERPDRHKNQTTPAVSASTAAATADTQISRAFLHLPVPGEVDLPVPILHAE